LQYTEYITDNEMVVYQSSTHPVHGWDIVQVILKDGAGQVNNSFVISCDRQGTIRRKTNFLLDVWEVVTDETELRGFRYCFNQRDKTVAGSIT